MAYVVNPYILESTAVTLSPKIITLKPDGSTVPTSWSGSHTDVDNGVDTPNDSADISHTSNSTNRLNLTFEDPATYGMISGDVANEVHVYIRGDGTNVSGDEYKTELFVNTTSQGPQGSRYGAGTIITNDVIQLASWNGNDYTLSECQDLNIDVYQSVWLDGFNIKEVELVLYINDSRQTLLPNGATGQLAGSYTDIDEGTVSPNISDYITLATSGSSGDTCTIDFTATGGLSGTVVGVNVMISSLPRSSGIDVELLIGGVSQGTTTDSGAITVNNNVRRISNANWDSAWSESQLDGAQVKLTNKNGGKLSSGIIYTVDLEILYA